MDLRFIPEFEISNIDFKLTGALDCPCFHLYFCFMTGDTRNSAPKQKLAHSGQWKPGQSGHPAGKTPGSRHRTTIFAEKLMSDDAEKVVRKTIELALAGDPTALRLVVERICPVRKGAPVHIEGVPDVKTLADVNAAIGAIVGKMMAGELSPEEAMSTAAVVEVQRRVLETVGLAARIEALEGRSSRHEP